MTQELSTSSQRVQDALRAAGVDCQVVVLPDSTRTAAEAAAAIGCRVEQIAKSIVFRTKSSQQPLLVIASGSNRVNEKRLAAQVGEPIEKPDADFVRATTGFAIGGVPPVGHATKVTTYLDEDILQLAEIWAAAGTPHAVFRLTPAQLQTLTGGMVICVK